MLRELPFQIATVLGAFLLFLVQPLMAKQILPWFGGAPAVWSACLVFFQLALIGGYVYAHLTRRLGAHWQAAAHLGLLLVALAALPILVSPEWKPADAGQPTGRVLLLLAATIGVPYVLLGATAPLLQDWWRRTSGREPYRLYALSNAGSLAALAAYPTVMEPMFSVPSQAVLWSVAYVGFVVACGWSASIFFRTSGLADLTESAAGREPDGGVRPGAIPQWIVLSACGSGLLVATTNQLCQDVAVVPMLWVLPLAVFLITFVLTFGGVYPRWASRIAFALGILSAGYVTMFPAGVPLLLQACAFLLLLGGGCMVCHGELVASRPGPRHLTEFYVALSVGGAVGGLFVAVVSPLLFTSYVELPMMVLIAVMLALLPPTGRLVGDGRLAGVALVMLWIMPAVFLAVAMVFVSPPPESGRNVVAVVRDFYGVIRVEDHGLGTARPWRQISHGRVLHGLQWLDESERRRPTSYFADGSGVAIAFQQHPARLAGQPLRAGVVGLGAGTIAAWGAAGDSIRFFELNPRVAEIAKRHFRFLDDSAAAVSIVTGDGRLALEREMADERNHGTYDLLVIDAFSGDSIPAHLLTRECFEVYLKALAPSGVLAFHISNLHLDLRPVIHGSAAAAGQSAVALRSEGGASGQGVSEWVLTSTDQGFLTRAASLGAASLAGGPQLVWTDSYSSLFSVLR